MTTAQPPLRDAVSACLNKHDLLDVLSLGAPADEYDPEVEDFTGLLSAGQPITAEVVATVRHKWLGDRALPAPAPTREMAALAPDLHALSAPSAR